MKNLKGKLDFLETMLKIRGFEQKIEELFSKGLLGGDMPFVYWPRGFSSWYY